MLTSTRAASFPETSGTGGHRLAGRDTSHLTRHLKDHLGEQQMLPRPVPIRLMLLHVPGQQSP